MRPPVAPTLSPLPGCNGAHPRCFFLRRNQRAAPPCGALHFSGWRIGRVRGESYDRNWLCGSGSRGRGFRFLVRRFACVDQDGGEEKKKKNRARLASGARWPICFSKPRLEAWWRPSGRPAALFFTTDLAAAGGGPPEGGVYSPVGTARRGAATGPRRSILCPCRRRRGGAGADRLCGGGEQVPTVPWSATGPRGSRADRRQNRPPRAGSMVAANPSFRREGPSAICRFHAPPFTGWGAAPDSEAGAGRSGASLSGPLYLSRDADRVTGIENRRS